MIFSQLEVLTKPEQKELNLLRDFIKNQKKVYVAYSGGVDSTLVAAIAQEQLGERAIAITGVSESLATYLLEEARKQASWIGITHQECRTNELQVPEYQLNPENRCFACKHELHNCIKQIAEKLDGYKVLDGVNLDDISEYRPGIKAAKNAGVISPLVELKIGKNSIRSISKALGFPWWDKPAQPCLSSRIPYGESISSQRLKRIEKAERWLIVKGYPKVRVRSQGLSARIELPTKSIEKLFKKCSRHEIVDYFINLGFSSVSIDLEGLVSGKLNRDREKNHQ